MTDDARGSELETGDGEVLPAREVMSIISTDPSDAFAPGPSIEPGPPPSDDGMSIQPVEHEPSDQGIQPVEHVPHHDPPHTLPVEEPPAA